MGHLSDAEDVTNKVKVRDSAQKQKRLDMCQRETTNAIIQISQYLGQIDGQRVEIVLDSGCDMTLVHTYLVDPKKINHHEHTHLRCIIDHNSDYPTAEVIIVTKREPFETVVGVSRDLPRHAL